MKRRFIYLIVIICLICINAYILVHRNEGYKYFPYKTYSQLYVTDSTLYLSDVFFAADTLQLFFSLTLPSPEYKLSVDNKVTDKTFVPVNNSLHIPLEVNYHLYKLIAADKKKPEIEIQVDYNKPAEINELLYCIREVQMLLLTLRYKNFEPRSLI